MKACAFMAVARKTHTHIQVVVAGKITYAEAMTRV